MVENINNLFICIKDIQKMKNLLVRLNGTFCQSAVKPVTLRFEEERKIAKISLTNPKKRNTLSLEAIKLLKDSLSQVEEKVSSKKAKILVLQGQGPVFCSGHDLKELGSSKNPQQIFDSCAELMLKLRNLPIPTLCVINGIAAAAGFQMAMACDLIIATQKSSFSTPGVKWGLFCSTPAVQLIRSISSQKKAMQMLIFGQPISAQQAYQYGLLNRVVPQPKLAETVNEFVTKANNLSTEVIAHGKNVLRNQSKESIQKAYCIAGKGMHDNISQKQDCKQGLKAFSQKRHPHYKN